MEIGMGPGQVIRRCHMVHVQQHHHNKHHFWKPTTGQHSAMALKSAMHCLEIIEQGLHGGRGRTGPGGSTEALNNRRDGEVQSRLFAAFEDPMEMNVNRWIRWGYGQQGAHFVEKRRRHGHAHETHGMGQDPTEMVETVVAMNPGRLHVFP